MKKILILIFFINFKFSVNAASVDYYNQGLKFFNLNDYKEAKFYFEKDIVFNIKNENSYLYMSKIAKIEKYKVHEKK